MEAGDDLLSGVEEWPASEEDQRLVAAEYFWDDDPGAGLGHPIAVPAGYSLASIAAEPLELSVDVPPLSLGYHRLGFRVQDGRARWSEPVVRLFTVERDVGFVALSPPPVPATNGLGVLAAGEWPEPGAVAWLSAVAPDGIQLHSNDPGAPSLAVPPALAGIENVRTAVWGDCDNDGLADLAVGFESAAGEGLRVFRNRGGGVLEAMPIPALPALAGGIRCLAWADLDRDGFLDLVAVPLSSPQLLILANRGGAGFDWKTGWEGIGGAGGRAVSVADLTGDGYPDIVWVGSEGVKLHRNLACISHR